MTKYVHLMFPSLCYEPASISPSVKFHKMSQHIESCLTIIFFFFLGTLTFYSNTITLIFCSSHFHSWGYEILTYLQKNIFKSVKEIKLDVHF